MKKKNDGFTLAELLVVVAIIGVLVAISVPIFSQQLHKARVATDWANVRNYYSQLQYDSVFYSYKYRAVLHRYYLPCIVLRQ